MEYALIHWTSSFAIYFVLFFADEMPRNKRQGTGSGVWEIYEDVARNKHKKKSFDNRYVSLAVSSMENAYKGPTKQPEAIHIEELAANIVVRTKIISEMHDDLRRTTQTTFHALQKKKKPKAKKTEEPRSKLELSPEEFEVVSAQLAVLDSEQDGLLEEFLNRAFEEAGIVSNQIFTLPSEYQTLETSLQFNEGSQSQSHRELRALMDTMDSSLFSEKFDLPKIEQPQTFSSEDVDMIRAAISRVPEREYAKEDIEQYMIQNHRLSPEIKGKRFPDAPVDDDMEGSGLSSEEDEVEACDIECGENDVPSEEIQISPKRTKSHPPRQDQKKKCTKEDVGLNEQKIFIPKKRKSSELSQNTELKPLKLRKPEQLQYSEKIDLQRVQYPHRLARPIFGDLVRKTRKGIEIDYTSFLSDPSRKITDHCMVFVENRLDFDDCLATNNVASETELNLEEDEDDPESHGLFARSEKDFFERIAENDIQTKSKRELSPFSSSLETPRSNRLSARVYSPGQTFKREKPRGIFDICSRFYHALEASPSISIKDFSDIEDPHAFVAMIHLAHSINTQNEKILPLMGGEGKDKFSVVVEGNRDLDEVVIEKESTKKV